METTLQRDLVQNYKETEVFFIQRFSIGLKKNAFPLGMGVTKPICLLTGVGRILQTPPFLKTKQQQATATKNKTK